MKTNHKNSEEFVTRKGVRLGSTLSPVLFTVPLDDLARELGETRVSLYKLEKLAIRRLMFEDSMVILEQTVREVSHQKSDQIGHLFCFLTKPDLVYG